MNIENVSAADFVIRNNSSEKTSANAPKFLVRAYSKDKSEQNTPENQATPDAVREMEKMTGKSTVQQGSYTVTEEEAAELREKYGDTYNEDTVYKLYDELVEKDIIDSNYFSYASGYGCAIPLSAIKSITFVGFGSDEINHFNKVLNESRNMHWVSDKIFFKDVSRTDKDAYRSEWESFKSQYDREINTWQDALQENIDFKRYLKEIATNSTSGKHYPSAESLNWEINGLEKIKDVIFQIFE